MTRITKAVGCAILSALPFAAGGIGGLIAFARGLRTGEEPARLVTLASMGLVFSLVGFGLMFAALRGRKDAERDAALRLQHPEEPWMWKAPWASRRIPDQSRSRSALLWALAIFWNGTMFPALVLLPAEIGKGNRAALLVLLFPLVGVGIVVMAVRATLRARRFQQSILTLETRPAGIGGALRGRVEVPSPELAAANALAIRLTAYERRTGQNSDETIVWQSDEEIAPGLLGRTATGVAIPIHILIPHDVPQTVTDGATLTTWRLSIDAELPGIDYSAVFDVPVFRTSASNAGISETNDARSAESRRPAEPAEPRSYVSSRTAEGREIRFPRFRARSLAVRSLGLTILLSVIVGVLFRTDLPRIIPVLLALFTILVFLVALDALLHASSIVLGRENIVLRRRVIGTTEHVIPRNEITAVKVKVETQTLGERAQAWYAITVHTRKGKTITAAKYIRRKREAEWVASQIREIASGT